MHLELTTSERLGCIGLHQESMWTAPQEKQLQRYTRGAERVLESRHLRNDVNA